MHRFQLFALPLLFLAPSWTAPALANVPPGQEQKEPASKDAEGFANPELLVTTEWLAEHGNDKGVAVVDVRGAEDFGAGHIPGALSIPTAATYDPKARGNIGPREQIGALLGSKGIDADTHVVLYDGGRSTLAARIFWTLEVCGHKQVSVVDGGLAKWSAEKRETATESRKATPVEYVLAPRPELCSTVDQVLEGLDDPEVVVLDARSTGEYTAGRIPAAVHIEWLKNYSDDKVPVFKSPAELRALYADQGVTKDKRVHAY